MTDQDMKNLEVLFQRYIGALAEDFQGKLDLVVEGHAALDRKIDHKFDQLTERVDHNSFMIQALNQKIDDVKTDLGQKIDGVKTDLDRKIDGVKTDLDQKIDGVEARLLQQIDGVAAGLTATDEGLSKKIDGVAADLKAHRADTEAHHGVYRVKES